jgi:hypothetical protein
MSRTTFGRAVVSGLMITTLVTCGGGGPSTPTASPSAPVQQVRTVLGNADFTLRAGSATFKAIDNPPLGMMDVTVDWANASNTINVYWADGRCPGFPNLQAGQCNVLAKAEGVTKPKRLTLNNTTANAVYNFWIYNAGSTTESGALEVGVTTNGPVVVASPTPLPGGGNTTDPRTGLPPGPVTQAKVAVRSIDTGGFNYRDPTQDGDGNWVVHPGEFVVFDFSQRNGAGEKCQWIKDPEWDVTDDDGIVEVRGSSQPFLLRVDILHKGYFEVTGEIDGIKANVLTVVSVSQGQ